jgi:small subunit ribosomal protein S21
LVKVGLQEKESQQQLLKRFHKKVSRSRILSDVRRKRWFISKGELKRIEKRQSESIKGVNRKGIKSR